MSECTCPGCGGDRWTWSGLSSEQETCPVCRGRGTVERDSSWWQRVTGLCLGLGFALVLVGLALVWGMR